MSDPVPAVTEAEATGETAALFADIRAVYGVSVVNLVWRHLATMPAPGDPRALAHVWGGLRPLYIDGTIAAEAEALRAAMPIPAVPAVPGFVPATLGLDDAALAGARAVMAAYDRTNAMALVALSAARARLHGRGGPAAAPRKAPAPPARFSLPPLVDLAAMAPATAELVVALNRMGAVQEHPVLASMYRNLAHWPEFLALAWGVLAPLHADGRLAQAIAAGLALAQSRAATLPPPPADIPPLDPSLHAPVDAALALFTGDAIARMLVVTAVLRRALG